MVLFVHDEFHFLVQCGQLLIHFLGHIFEFSFQVIYSVIALLESLFILLQTGIAGQVRCTLGQFHSLDLGLNFIELRTGLDDIQS